MKTNKLFSITLFSALLFLGFIVQAAQIDNSKQTRTVSEFHGISLSTGIDLYLLQKSIQEVKVEADEEDMKNLITEVEDGILKIYMKETSEQLDAHASSGGDIDYSGNPVKKEIKTSSGGDVHAR